MPRNTVWILPKKTLSGGTGPLLRIAPSAPGSAEPAATSLFPERSPLPRTRKPAVRHERRRSPLPHSGTRLRTALGRGTGAPPPPHTSPSRQASGPAKLWSASCCIGKHRTPFSETREPHHVATSWNQRRATAAGHGNFSFRRQARPSQRAAWNQSARPP